MTFAIVFGAVAGVMLFIALSATLNGWALSILWGWFMVPLGLPALNVPTAIGLALVISYITHQNIPDDQSKTAGERFTESVVLAVLKPFLALGIGWIVTKFL